MPSSNSPHRSFVSSLSPSTIKEMLEDEFDEITLKRGVRYAQEDRVLIERVDEDHRGEIQISARVRGSDPSSYKVLVRICDEVMADSRCSCPVSYECKHAVATLVAFASSLSDSSQKSVRPTLPGVSSSVNAWLSDCIPAPPTPHTIVAKDVPLGYFLQRSTPAARYPIIELAALRTKKDGQLTRGARCYADVIASQRNIKLEPVDRMLCAALELLHEPSTLSPAQIVSVVQAVFDRLPFTGRFYYESTACPLQHGPAQSATVEWVRAKDGTQRLCITADAVFTVLPSVIPLYVDQSSGLVGLLETGLTPDALLSVVTAPTIAGHEAEAVARRLQSEPALATLPLPRPLPREIVHDRIPTPVLRLETPLMPSEPGDAGIVSAYLALEYGDQLVAPEASAMAPIRIDCDDTIHLYPRLAERELHTLQQLLVAGFIQVDPTDSRIGKTFLASRANALLFIAEDLPELRRLGWRIDLSESLEIEILDGSGAWNAELEEDKNQWFSLALDLDVDGIKVALLPLLAALLDRLDADNIEASLEARARNGNIYVNLADGRLLRLPLPRVAQLLAVLIELHGDRSGGNIRLSRFQALSFCAASPEAVIVTNERLRRFAQRLTDRIGIRQRKPPKALRATLRPYQVEGVSWLQFLREYQLGGILADDMGLGKTIQTITHLLLEKAAGRLRCPALIVAPTSVLPNWVSEVQRFAPSLRLLVVHGPSRAEAYAAIPRSDVVLTSYPILSRDKIFAETSWSTVILDEAQVIKNPFAKVAETARELQAEHRICLTGTPMENHVGELWSLFEFLMPGLLRDQRTFTRHYRTPIEKNNDLVKQAALISRVQPFILRRTKELVARELPAKTEVIKLVELGSDQRDLYESVRAIMDKKLRDEVSRRGWSRSKIIMLDALLKLRQVCCDPRLVKLKSARKVKHSAKLTALLEMLDQLMSEGRQVIVFSQFTAMLELIKAELQARNYTYVELNGSTVDRKTPVDRFQNRDVPIFLISLKAGGTGLNLTAADVVIHYDPWWNPAVERQATDRAHRIGRKDPVVVYKFVVAGSVEERIVAMQERKAALTGAIIESKATAQVALSNDDLASLFKTLGDT